VILDHTRVHVASLAKRAAADFLTFYSIIIFAL